MFWQSDQHSKNKTVFVGVSGGVDSSVATHRLINQGYTVVGAFMKTWYPDWLPCDWKSERRDAMRVCAKLGIPFVEYDLGEQYFNEVGMYLVNEYKSGRTPNPDVMCNKHVKFDAFWQATVADGADYIATGHYARRLTTGDSLPVTTTDNCIKGACHYITQAVDENKDQTYFLWGINPDNVSNILLPVGSSSKDTIRKEADRVGLVTANKPDSQGICFLGQVNLTEFLSHYLDLESGAVYDTGGKQVGTHESAYVYTIGQRHGFNLDNTSTNSEPMYVISKDVENNVLVVGTKSELEISTKRMEVSLGQTNWFRVPQHGDQIQVRFRYRQPLINASVQSIDTQAGTATINFSDHQSGIAPGQSLVMYDGQIMIGGGIITY